jgi:hypothetical protein
MSDESDAPEDMMLFSPGTIVHAPIDGLVAIQFPNVDDAIVFHEFLRAFVNNEFDLEIVKR